MIKLAVCDVDGTLTDGKINYCSNGELFKSFNVKDGQGLVMLNENNITTAFVTARNSEIVSKRAEDLKINYVLQSVANKVNAVEKLIAELKLSWTEVAFIGDDLNDLDVIKLVGFSGCPQDSVETVKREADYVCTANGGCGAAREFCEQIIMRNTQA